MELTGSILSFALYGTDWTLVAMILLSLAAFTVVIMEAVVLLRGRSDIDTILRITMARVFSKESNPLEKIKEDIGSMRGMEARTIREGITRLSGDRTAAAEMIQGLVELERLALERGLFFLGVILVLAPGLGALGSVIGMINAFQEYANNPSAGPGLIMIALAEGLVPLVVGLMIALPCYLANAYFKRRIQSRMAKLNVICHLLQGGTRSSRQ